MKKLTLFVVMVFAGAVAHAKLSDQQAMKCINGDPQIKSAFQDIQAAYEMRLVSAKDFFKVMEKPANCPQLKKDIKKLRVASLSTFPREKANRLDVGHGSSSGGFSGGGFGGGAGSGAPSSGGAGGFTGDTGSDFSGFPPPPAAMPDDFGGDDFSDFR